MKIRLRDIEHETARQMKPVIAEVLAAGSSPTLTGEKATLHDVFKQLPPDRVQEIGGWIKLALFIFLIVGAPMSCIRNTNTHSDTPFFVFVGLMSAFFIGGFTANVLGDASLAQTRVHPRSIEGLMRIALPGKIGDAYSRLLRELMEDKTPLSLSSQRDLLTQANRLIADCRNTARQQAEIERALGGQTLIDMQTERRRLAERLSSAEDENTRGTLQASLRLCDERMARASKLMPLLERLDAQQEIIYQAQAGAHSSLAGLALAGGSSSIHTDSTAPLNVVNETVRQIQRETSAVEQAVQEVMSVR